MTDKPDRPKGIRAQRTEQIIKPGTYGWTTWFVEGVVESARFLLLAAHADGKTLRSDANFLTRHGPAAIVVAVTALECFVNQTLQQCKIQSRNDAPFDDLVRRDSLTEKLRDIPKLMGGYELPTGDIELVQQVRHEVAHHYARAVGPTNVPQWLQALAEKGLFYEIGTPPHDVGWQQKLQSFQLARWCAAVTCQTAQDFVSAIRGNQTDEKSPAVFVSDLAQISVSYFRGLLI